jgi:pyruvate dehydrogenase E1 component beta subunit
MEPKRSYRAFKEEVPEEEEVLKIGKAQVVQEGEDLTLISWGAMMRPTLQAMQGLKERRGASIELIDLLTISPMDGKTVADSVRKTGRCVIVQEAPRSLGVAAEIVARINERSFDYLEAPIRRVANFDVVTPYFSREMMYMPNPQRIERAMEETLDY